MSVNKSPVWYYTFGVTATVAVFFLCLILGSVSVPISDTLDIITGNVRNQYFNILVHVRLPRVLNAALCGAALALCGAATQGLLRNPLAESSTLGVSSGASLGAVLAIGVGIHIPNAPFAGTMIMAILFAFLSLLIIISLAYKMDSSLSTNTIILSGIIFSMMANSVISLIIAFSKEKVQPITFWMMGSLASSTYVYAGILLVTLLIFGFVILKHAGELNAFAIGEDNARNIGIDVRRVKFTILLSVSVLVGVCVSIAGTIGFVGLVIPHMTRLLVGPNHKRLLPAAVFSGALFLMLADLFSRTVISPVELPIGVVTSLVGSVAFINIFYHSKKIK